MWSKPYTTIEMVKKILLRKRVFLFSVLFICNISFCQKIIRFSDNKEFDSIVIVDGDKKSVIHKNDIFKSQFQKNSKVLYNNKLSDFVFDNGTLTFFDKVEEIDEVVIDEGNKKKVENLKIHKNHNKKDGITTLFSNCKTAFPIKFDAKDNTYIKAINLTVYERKNFDKNLGKLKIQILENKEDFPDDNNLLMEFEKNLSDFNLKFNNYLLSKIKIEFPKKLKYPQKGIFIVIEYVAPKSEYIFLIANKKNFYWWFFPKENSWKHTTDMKEFYYTLDIIK